ncbi:MAG: heme-binding protein [Rhodospirillales bacterium]|nr:heme-binding protein [Alphaproteobacteria bacterium]MBL6947449.1 heme-binding protein [Rhodospirillales bacterium]
MTKLTLDQAAKIIEAAFAKGRDIGCHPLSVAVLDAGGHPVAFMRQDDSGILRPEIASGKAYGALGFGLGSRELKEKNPQFLAAVAAASGGRMVPAPGGVLILEDGEIIGAVGISGDNSGNDEACAIAGIEAVGLTAEPGA